MSKAIELAEYCDGLAFDIEHTHYTGELTDAADELRRLAAVEQENANLLAANRYTNDIADQALHDLKMCQQELADLKAAMGEPVAWLHQCRKKPELKKLSFQKSSKNLASLGFAATPLYAIKAAK